MAHIAIITTGLTGILNASFEIVSRLKSEGHEVTYLCPQNMQDRVEHLGIRYVQLPEVNFTFSILDSSGTKIDTFKGRLKHYFSNLLSNYALGKKTLKIDAFSTIFSELNPDKLIIDVELHEFVFVATELSIPVVLICPWFDNRVRSNVPPMSTNIIPGISKQGTIFGILWTWFKYKVREFESRIKLKLTLKSGRRAVLKKYAKEVGISTRTLIPSIFPPVFLYSKLPTLLLVSKALDFPHAYFSNVTYVGGMVSEKRAFNDLELPNANKLDDILNEVQTHNKQLLYCSFGTMYEDNIPFIKKLMKACSKNLKRILLISLGGKLSLDSFDNVPANVYLFNYLPQVYVLKHAHVSINHCGINTINECIHYAVPMLVFSGGLFDQNGNAARVAYHQYGIRGNKRTDDASMIENKLNLLLDTPIYKNNMKKINAEYEQERVLKFSSYLD
ncbi:MAG: UDP:flavonoid glycosyltransferase YjiC (YdhE family) [Alphaproteobacteria bacterium]|jgi:UDP:flavonoid glycosyltransferase YjiC (YdhE family)